MVSQFRIEFTNFYRYWLVPNCLNDEIAYNTPITDVHFWSKCVENACNANVDIFLEIQFKIFYTKLYFLATK